MNKGLSYGFPLNDEEARKINRAVRVIKKARRNDLPREKRMRIREKAMADIREAVEGVESRV